MDPGWVQMELIQEHNGRINYLHDLAIRCLGSANSAKGIFRPVWNYRVGGSIDFSQRAGQTTGPESQG